MFPNDPLVVEPATFGCKNPSSQPVGDITGITFAAAERVAQVSKVYAATVVEPSSLVVDLRSRSIYVCNTGARQMLNDNVQIACKSISHLRTTNSIHDHALYLIDRTRKHHFSFNAFGSLVARMYTIMILHQAWICVCIGSSVDTDTTKGLLHHDGENEAMIDTCLYGCILNSRVDL